MSILTRILRTDATSAAPVALRIALASVFIGHGAQKLFGWWGGYGFQATSHFFETKLGFTPGALHAALAGGTEFFGGALLALGLFTRFAAAQLAVVMGVAIWSVHHAAFFADKGGMEYPLTLLLAAIALVLTGGGAFSFDALLAKRCPCACTAKKD